MAPDLAAVIQAVVDGGLVPIGRTEWFRGITGCLSRSEDLRKYRPAPGVIAPPEGFLSFKEAAALAGVRTTSFAGLQIKACSALPTVFGTVFRGFYPLKRSSNLRNATYRHQSSPSDSNSTLVYSLPEGVGHTHAGDPYT